MDVGELRRREILERKRRLQLSERRKQRRKEVKQIVASGDGLALPATTLAEVEAVTSRPGFLREQLKSPNLTPLRRWYLQLQLLVAEDCETPLVGDDMESALQACESALGQDKCCFDVVYRQGARVADAREALLDESARMDIREMLSFSTRCNGFVCRVTCVNDGKQVAVNSSEYINGLQPHLQLLLYQKATPASSAISFIHNALQ